MKLTKRVVDALEWNGKATHIEYDDVLTGFGLRLYPSGAKSFVVSLHPKGHGRRRIKVIAKVGQLTVDEARAEALQLLADSVRGIDPVAEERARQQAEQARVLFRVAAEAYLVHASLPGEKTTWKQDRQRLRKDILPILGRIPVSEITRRDISRVTDRVLARGAKYVANRTLATVSVILSFCVDRGWIEANPCFRMKHPCKEQPRRRFLSEEEIIGFWKGTDELRDITGIGFRLILLTGQRPIRETLGMRWDEIDLSNPDDSWWYLPAERSKNRRPNLVPLNRLAVEQLTRVRELDLSGPFVFPSHLPNLDQPITDPSRPRRDLYKTCGFHFQLKDLRRTVATHLPRLGHTRFVVARILNHTDPTVTAQHYDHFEYAAEKKSALDSWGLHIEQLVSGDVQPVSSFLPAAAAALSSPLLDRQPSAS